MAKRQVRTLPEIHVDIGSHNNPRRRKTPKTIEEMSEKQLRDYLDSFHRARDYGAEFEKVAEYYNSKFLTGKHSKNPAPRLGTSRPTRVSQRTGQKPTKRLVSRRKANTRAGYFPNPVEEYRNVTITPEDDGTYRAHIGKRTFGYYNSVAQAKRGIDKRLDYEPNPAPLNIKHPKNIIAAPFWIYQTYKGKREFIAATKSAATGNALAGLMQKNAKAGAFFDVVKAY